MPEIIMSVTKTEISSVEKQANRILKSQGIDPDEYWYQFHLKIIMDNLDKILDIAEQNSKGVE